MNVVWHNFHAFDCESLIIRDFQKDGFQTFVNFTDQHLAPVFHAPDKMVVDVIDGRSGMDELFISHDAENTTIFA
jgi:hypothetical protein